MTSLIRHARLDTSDRLLEASTRKKVVAGIVVPPLAAEPNVNQLPVNDEPMRAQTHEAPVLPGDVVEAPPIVPESPKPLVQTYEEFRAQLGEELDQLRAAASEQGYAEGLQAGRENAAQEVAERLTQLANLVVSLRAGLEHDLDGLIDIGGEVVFEAVTRIIGRSYLDREGVMAVVREVISHAKDRSRLVIRVNPADYIEIDTARDNLTEGWNNQQVEILADDRVELGGCLLETPAGNLDGRLEVQLQQLRDTLLNARLRRSESVLQP